MRQAERNLTEDFFKVSVHHYCYSLALKSQTEYCKNKTGFNRNVVREMLSTEACALYGFGKVAYSS